MGSKPGGRLSPLMRGVEPVIDQIHQHAGDFLRIDLHHPHAGVEVFFQRNIEPRRFSSRAVLGKVQRLLRHRVQIHRPMLGRAGPRMQQHVLDDAVGAPESCQRRGRFWFLRLGSRFVRHVVPQPVRIALQRLPAGGKATLGGPPPPSGYGGAAGTGSSPGSAGRGDTAFGANGAGYPLC